ncbi:hypothetical protein ABZZ47_12315 [Streptomyces sp. NPDC006465]|uniref:hypothetical protein n=1 Tax=Streptomyces sp. NPDC006465 TaxID=3157174 RepID=UPI0033A7E33E
MNQQHPQQQLAWGTPPPPQPPKKRKTGKTVGLGCLGVFAFLLLMGIVSGGSDDTTGAKDGNSSKGDTKSAAPVPHYKVVKQDKTGHKRNVVVEVGTTKNLRGVFNAVTDSLTKEAGYYVMINCSTGGTKHFDNRLANGQYAIGKMGTATTGLEDRGTEFSTNKGRTCPVSAAEVAQREADQKAALKAAGIPLEPTGAKRAELLRALAAVNPDIVQYEDKAINAARNQCSAINGGSTNVNRLASSRFTYRDVTTTEAQGRQINQALQGLGFCKV